MTPLPPDQAAAESAQSASPRPPVVAELVWTRDLIFDGRSGAAAMTLDSDGEAGPSPMQTLLLAFAGCMGMDIVHFLNKSRVPATAVRLGLSGRRAAGHPGRFTAIDLHVELDGAATDAQVARSIELSRSTYCSVWNSMSQDIALNVTFTVNRPPQ
jgi:putative redox protein